MIRHFKKILKNLANFLCYQYIILFFTLAGGIKLICFNRLVLHYGAVSPIAALFCFLSVAILLSPLYFVKKHKNKYAFIITSLISILLFADTVYFSYFDCMPAVGMLDTIGQIADVKSSISGLIHWQSLFYFADLAFVLITHKSSKKLLGRIKQRFNIVHQNVKTSLLFLALNIIVFMIALVPMGLTNFNNVINRGYDTVSTTDNYGVIMAHIVDIIRFIKQETVKLPANESAELINWVETNQPEQITSSLNAIASGKNVIMIQVESLGGFVINQTINGQEITPNLNKLAGSTYYYSNNRFLYGGGHTSDSDFAANTSYFPLNDASVFVRYGEDDFTSLANTLIDEGYSTYAYHGYNRNFWNRDAALSSLGYQVFYAAENYSDGEKLNMGLNDGTFLSETVDYIKEQPKPSLSYVITLSSHVPFEITNLTNELGLKAEDYPEGVAGYLENIHYTDKMLGEFFDKLKSEGLYDDSLIILYGDHTPVLSSFTAGTITYDPDATVGKEVPLMIKLPNQTVGETYKNEGSTLDITPTILDLLGINTTQLMFGQSLFADGSSDALSVCSDQFETFASSSCEEKLNEEKDMSAKIIRYNQFNKLIY